MNRISYVILTLLLILASGCKSNLTDSTFRVAVPFILNDLDPHHNTVNVQHYINIHLYYPLFQADDNGKLTSEFLDIDNCHATDKTFKRYKLCIKNGLYFSDSSTIQIEDLIFSLKSTHSAQMNLWPLRSIEAVDKHCLLLELENKDMMYFDKLTTIQSTLIKKNSSPSRPVGLGPYTINHSTKEKLSLTSNPSLSFDFKNIEFIITNPKLANKDSYIQDWNHNYIFDVPERIKKDSLHIRRKLFKVYVLVIDYKDIKIRKQITACFNAHKIENYFPLLSKDHLNSFLPEGIQGYQPNKEYDWGKCNSASKNIAINFVCAGEKQCSGIKMFLRQKQDQLPFKINLTEIDSKDYAKHLLSENESVMIVGLDSYDYEPSTFFQIFLGNEKVTLTSFDEIKLKLLKAARSDNTSIKESIIHELHNHLLDSKIVYPIGQVIVDQFYPKYITNLRILNKSTGFPQINLLKIQ